MLCGKSWTIWLASALSWVQSSHDKLLDAEFFVRFKYSSTMFLSPGSIGLLQAPKFVPLLNRCCLLSHSLGLNSKSSDTADNRSREIKRMSGRQDTFYFEESPQTIAMGQAERAEAYKRTPLVLLFGWAGAKDQNLQKYKSIYSSFGFHTLRFSPSNQLTFFNQSKHKQYAYDLLSLMRNQHELVENPILIHMFSNACGIIMYQHIINEINGTNGVVSNKDYAFFKRNHRGIIFDSSPGMPIPSHLFGGVLDLTQGHLKSTIARYIFSAAAVSLFAAYQAINLNNS